MSMTLDEAEKEIERLRALVLDAHTIIIHAEKFKVNDLQAGLHRDFMSAAVDIRCEKNRKSNGRK